MRNGERKCYFVFKSDIIRYSLPRIIKIINIGKRIEKIIIAGVSAALKEDLSIGDTVLCNNVCIKKPGSDELEDKIGIDIPA